MKVVLLVLGFVAMTQAAKAAKAADVLSTLELAYRDKEINPQEWVDIASEVSSFAKKLEEQASKVKEKDESVIGMVKEVGLLDFSFWQRVAELGMMAYGAWRGGKTLGKKIKRKAE